MRGGLAAVPEQRSTAWANPIDAAEDAMSRLALRHWQIDNHSNPRPGCGQCAALADLEAALRVLRGSLGVAG